MNDVLSDEQKRDFENEFIGFFSEERGEVIGTLVVQNFLDFFSEHLGSKYYNAGIEIGQSLLKNKLEEISFEFEELKK